MQEASLAELAEYQTDALFLLVGGNPLPNYVAARLLAAEGGCVYLLHSPETMSVADRLKCQIPRSRDDLTLVPRQIDRADTGAIRTKLDKILENLPSDASVGLNFTGGTKPMAVQTYHSLRQAYPRAVFSYLDARTLTMVLDDGRGRTQAPPVGRALKVSLNDLLALHDYRQRKPFARDQAIQPDLCAAIAQVHARSPGPEQWRDWLKTLGQDGAQLPTAETYPAVAPAITAFDQISRGRQPPEPAVAEALGFVDLKSCTCFFNGGWLEDYTLYALGQYADELGLHECVVDLKPVRSGAREFQIDVAAMRGYQLFAISCIVTDQRDRAKEHLLEIFARARQVGGDEARFALVSLYNRTESLQREIEQELDAEGKIRVFGQQDLLALDEGLRDWIETANREVL